MLPLSLSLSISLSLSLSFSLSLSLFLSPSLSLSLSLNLSIFQLHLVVYEKKLIFPKIDSSYIICFIQNQLLSKTPHRCLRRAQPSHILQLLVRKLQYHPSSSLPLLFTSLSLSLLYVLHLSVSLSNLMITSGNQFPGSHNRDHLVWSRSKAKHNIYIYIYLYIYIYTYYIVVSTLKILIYHYPWVDSTGK